MKKFPKIKYPNDAATDGILDRDVVVTEKLDGANFRWNWEGGDLSIGTRNVVYDDPDDPNVANAFGHAIEYIRDTTVERLDSVTFFGEAMHLHSLDYEDIDWKQPHKGSPHVPIDSDVPNVVVFDAYDHDAGEWYDWETVVELTNRCGLQIAPVLDVGNPDDVSLEVPEESVFGGPPEGIVVRRLDGSVRAKKVTDDFKEKNAVAFNDSSKAQSDAGEFVSTYVTDARIEKIAHKLVDEGDYDSLQMEMMEQLPKRVLEDAVAENAWELLSSGGLEVEWDDDFKGEVRSKSSKKCARTLKQAINSF